MGSLLNFILPQEGNYGKWVFEGPMTQKIKDDYSCTIFPELKENHINYILIEPTEALNGLVKKIDIIFRKEKNLKNFIEENRLKIIIVSLADPPSNNTYEVLQRKLKFHNIFEISKVLTSNIKLQSENLNSFHFFIEQALSSTHPMFGEVTDLGYISEEIQEHELYNFRNKKFLSFNRTVDKPHRLSLFHDYLTNDFSDSYFSFLRFESGHCNPYQIKKLKTEEYLKNIPIQLDTNNFFDFSVNNTMRKDLFLNCCINLVTETSYNQNELFISEKILKPILNYQPFIVFGPYNYLKELKRLGFKTFSDFWDESYDDILDGEKRYLTLSKLVLKLNRLSIEEINNLYKQTLEICIYNKNYLKELKLDSINLFLENLSNE